MSSESQYIHAAAKYESNGVKLFFQGINKEPQNLAFLFPVMVDYLKSEIPGKKVVDIGCGTGTWCYKAALSGAKSVDGFDIQEEMAELAKQATSQFGNVNICVGDVMDMPYEDNTFDVALSFYVTCSLRLEACISHFKEMYRVLAPGGKAMVVSHTKAAFTGTYLRNGVDQMMVEKQIARKLMNLPAYPSQDQINHAFKDFSDLVFKIFIIDQNGQLQRIADADKVSIGQATWSKTEIMTFANYFYDDDYLQQQIKAAGFNIDNIENYYTEERRVAYNNTNPEIELDKAFTDTPPLVMYHLSKPVNV